MEFTRTDIPSEVASGSKAEAIERREFSVGGVARPAAAEPDPKAPAPSASSSGTSEAGKAATAPGTAETAAGEKPKEETKPEEKADGKAFAALKRERQRTEAAVAQARPLIEAKEAWEKGDVDTVLTKLGIAGDKLVDLWVKKQGGTGAEGETTEAKADAPEVEALRKRLDELEGRLRTASQEQQATQALQQHQTRLAEALKADPARWEMTVKDPQAPAIAFDVMFHHNQRTGEFLTYEAALDAVEDFKINEELAKALPDRAARRALLGAKTQSGDKPAASPAATGANEANPEDKMRQAFGLKPRVTVNNTAASAAPVTATRPNRGEDADRRFAERVAALQRGG